MMAPTKKKSALEDEHSLLSQFKLLAREKDKKELLKLKMAIAQQH